MFCFAGEWPHRHLATAEPLQLSKPVHGRQTHWAATRTGGTAPHPAGIGNASTTTRRRLVLAPPPKALSRARAGTTATSAQASAATCVSRASCRWWESSSSTMSARAVSTSRANLAAAGPPTIQVSWPSFCRVPPGMRSIHPHACQRGKAGRGRGGEGVLRGSCPPHSTSLLMLQGNTLLPF